MRRHKNGKRGILGTRSSEPKASAAAPAAPAGFSMPEAAGEPRGQAPQRSQTSANSRYYTSQPPRTQTQAPHSQRSDASGAPYGRSGSGSQTQSSVAQPAPQRMHSRDDGRHLRDVYSTPPRTGAGAPLQPSPNTPLATGRTSSADHKPEGRPPAVAPQPVWDDESELKALLREKDDELASLTQRFAGLHARMERVAKVLQDTAPTSGTH